jgi:hypothetical protein
MKVKSLFISSMAVVALLAVAQPAQAQCGVDVLFNSHCYRFTSRSADWLTSSAEAHAAGGYLTSIGSAVENAFLFSTFGSQVGDFWIGLNDIANEGTYLWDSGETVTYTNWHPFEPNNSNNEDAVHFCCGDGTWNDNNVFYQTLGVIEYDSVVATPEPASLALMATGLGVIAGARARRRRR